MYPFIRLAKEMIKFRKSPRIGLLDTHVSHHVCWPWDLDPWVELNNGRTLTLYDLGRLPLIARTGFIPVLKGRKWGFTVAGNSTRYRRRIRMFHRFTMLSRVIGWDNRFIYMEQSMWRKGECCNHMLLRTACTSDQGIVPPAQVMDALALDHPTPDLPDWVQAWIQADGQRPWPPVVPQDAKNALISGD